MRVCVVVVRLFFGSSGHSVLGSLPLIVVRFKVLPLQGELAREAMGMSWYLGCFANRRSSVHTTVIMFITFICIYLH